MLEIGEQVGPYELLAKLGSGGMATLYVARKAGAAGFSRLAAVKVVHSHLVENERFVLMFVDEAKLSARIDHPNVVRVEDFGEHAGRYYMGMEYVHGCSLSQLLGALAKRGRRLEPGVAVSIALQVAAGLHAAHECRDEQGRPLELVHRDVSPQNILLSYAGHVKLIDFGIAKARFRAQQTRSRGVKGKLSYMAPEQIRRKPLDRRTDLYALAIVLWEMLTMRRYFRAPSEPELIKLIAEPRTRLASQYASLAPALDEVLQSALSPDPETRPSSALELKRLLGHAYPEALAVEPEDLAALLADLMTDQRAALVARMPDALADGMTSAEDATDTTSRARTMTEVHESAEAYLHDDDDDLEQLEEEEQKQASAATPTPPELAVPAAESRRGLKIGVGLTAAVVAAALGAFAFPGEEPTPPPVVEQPPVIVPPTEPEPEPEPEPPPDPAALLAEAEAQRAAARLGRARACAETGEHDCVVAELAGRAQTEEELSLLIDGHRALGEDAVARRLAERYLRAHPEGPAGGRLREWLEPPARVGRRAQPAPEVPTLERTSEGLPLAGSL